jgi:hypothetical protein
MDTVGELERLKALFESGALSEQEFADAKAKIIGAGEKVHAPSLAPTSGFAIASLVLGLLVLPSPLGLIFGLIALSQIKKTQGNLKGRGIAIAGVTISAVFSFGLIIVITLTGGIGLSLFQFNKASKKTVHLPAPKLAILPAVKLDTDSNKANVEVIEENLRVLEQFIKEASVVIERDQYKPPPEFTQDDLGKLILKKVEELNAVAKTNGVVLPSGNKGEYDFTFTPLKNGNDLNREEIVMLYRQLHDIDTICRVLFSNKVKAISKLQRTPVTESEKTAKGSSAFLVERSSYTNNIAVMQPYKVRFQCLSGGIAKSLNGFASEDKFIVIRKMEVTNVDDNASDGVPADTAPQATTSTNKIDESLLDSVKKSGMCFGNRTQRTSNPPFSGEIQLSHSSLRKP